MTRKHVQTLSAILCATAGIALAAPTSASAQDSIGGFATEMPSRERPKREKVERQPIVDVRLDPAWEGPRSIREALALVEKDGEIVVHPGTYAPESVNLTRSVSIRGIRDDYGRAPTLRTRSNCLSIRSSDVNARVSDITFEASAATCLAVRAGSLELMNSEVLGERSGPAYAYQQPGNASSHLRPFTQEAATMSRSALVEITGGRVRITNTTISGGETGVMINPGDTSYAFDHVDLQGNTISQMTGAGVVMMGDVEATLASNRIVSNQLSGVVYAGTGHARLVGNIISNNANNGLYVQGMGEAVSIEGNKIHDNTEDGIEVRSGVAILVGNDIGAHSGCRVNPNAPEGDNSGHLAMPPITLLADPSGQTRYDTSSSCSSDEPRSRRDRRNRRRR